MEWYEWLLKLEASKTWKGKIYLLIAIIENNSWIKRVVLCATRMWKNVSKYSKVSMNLNA